MDKAIETIKKLTKLFKELCKLLGAIGGFLTTAIGVELTIKTLIEIWEKL